MNKTILKIEIATQNKLGLTATGLLVHGPGRDWGNLVAHELSQANVPSGDLVHLTIWYTNNKTTYQFFSW